MELLNGDTLVTAIDIPAGNMQKQGIDLFVAGIGAGYNNVAPPSQPRPETPAGAPRPAGVR
jgi:hypothetical protein